MCTPFRLFFRRRESTANLDASAGRQAAGGAREEREPEAPRRCWTPGTAESSRDGTERYRAVGDPATGANSTALGATAQTSGTCGADSAENVSSAGGRVTKASASPP